MAALGLLLVAAGPASALNLPSLSGILPRITLLEALFSPGPVNVEHLDAGCTSCHVPLKGVRPEGCAGGNCHTPAKLAAARPAAAAVHERNSGRSCTACHPEHNGRLAALTEPFHQTAVPDAQSDCASCHGAEGKKAHPDIRSPGCLDCHRSTSSWKNIVVNHTRLADLACAECHAPQGSKVHPALDGQKCDACHRSTSNWEKVQVDHGRLTGATCADCHAPQGRKAHPSITERKCDACHQSTFDWRKVSIDHRALGGQACAGCHTPPATGLHTQTRGSGCDNCHNATAWKPARFSHASLAASTGQRCADCHSAQAQKAHPAIRSADCAGCHSPSAGWAAAKFNHAQVSRNACAGCHTPPATQLHVLAKNSSCATCHGTGAWKPTQFRHPRIPEMREHLGEVGCRRCHPTSLSEAVSCQHCHSRGRFDDD